MTKIYTYILKYNKKINLHYFNNKINIHVFYINKICTNCIFSPKQY